MAEGIAKVTSNREVRGNVETTRVAWVETTDLDLGDPKNWKFITALSMVIERSGAMTVLQIGWRDRIEEDLQWSKDYSLSELDQALFLEDVPTARFYRFKLFDPFVVSRWRWSRLDIFGGIDGGRL